MAERWQQWMPFHIDRFRGSQEVQAMHPAARCGYLYLLASAWQSPDCMLSADAIDLATTSGLGDELWSVHGPRILRKFVQIGERLRNEVLFAEWDEARKVYEKRKKGAVRTNSSRSANAVRTDTERQADTVTETETRTEPEKKPSRDKREADSRHTPFKLAVEAYAKYKSVPVQWGPAEAKQLDLLLKSSPELTLQQFQICLNHRARSPGVPHGEPPRAWLPSILRYLNAPLNEFNKEPTNAGTQHSQGRKFDAAQHALQQAIAGIDQEELHGGVREDVPRSRGSDGPTSSRVLLAGAD